jgi:hypothetical protein
MKNGRQGEGGGAPKGVKKTAAHKAKIADSQKGKENSNYKHGKRIDSRKIVGLKPNDGKVVSHKDHDRTNNSKSNLEVLNDAPKSDIKKAGRRTTPKHEQHHAKTDPRK